MEDENKLIVIEKIDSIQKDLNILRNDMLKINHEVNLIKNLIAEYLFINKKEIAKPKEKVNGYLWGSY